MNSPARSSIPPEEPLREQSPVEGQPVSGTAQAPEQVRDVRRAQCCVVGGGPAGVIVSYLLARQGVSVILLEAHKDFDRKFRGDTIHPSVLEVMDQLGLAERLHELRHTKMYGPTLQTGDGPFMPFDFRRLKTKFPYIMIVPQVDFLNLVVEEAMEFPSFELQMGASVVDVVKENGAVRGVRYRSDDGIHEVRSDVTIGADGRFSRLRHLAGFLMVMTAPPMDVLWFNLPRLPEGPPVEGLTARFGAGRALIVFDRGDHFQAGYIFTKGRYQQLKEAGLEALKASIVEIEPAFAEHVESLKSWQDVTLLSVQSSRCRKWYADGLLLVGDAAHVMSPVGGVGINYAIHDAVEAANILGGPLKEGRLTTKHLKAVQKRRTWPTRFIQAVQAFVQRQIIERVLNSDGPVKVPRFVRLLLWIPFLRNLPARIIGFGIGRSHVKLSDGSYKDSNTR